MVGSFVYLIISDEGHTYVGSTVDIQRRLRQHNGEISGGARYTTARRGWVLAAWVSGFPTWEAALQFEWRWKDITRKSSGSDPLKRRITALYQLIHLERSTRSAVAFIEWPEPIEIHCEIDRARELWEAANT